jgi:hypothetical protein
MSYTNSLTVSLVVLVVLAHSVMPSAHMKVVYWVNSGVNVLLGSMPTANGFSITGKEKKCPMHRSITHSTDRSLTLL